MKAQSRVLHLFMAAVIFVSSTGFGLMEHTCRIRGSKQAFITEPSSCCTQEHPAGKKDKKGCCDTESKFLKLDPGSAFAKIKTFFQALFVALSQWVTEVFTQFFLSAAPATVYTDTSPPLSGRDRLIWHHTFRI